jgi:hypothetical protein
MPVSPTITSAYYGFGESSSGTIYNVTTELQTLYEQATGKYEPNEKKGKEREKKKRGGKEGILNLYVLILII